MILVNANLVCKRYIQEGETYDLMAKKKNTTGIPQHEIDSLARAFLPAILDFYRSEEGQREFAEWKAKRDAQKQYPQLNKKD